MQISTRGRMKIQCDVCEKAPATVICCADEAALCAKCDIEVHAANKLASKHQRLLLQCLPSKLPTCDICQEKPAFLFCVEDRALLCQNCDEPIHPAGSLSANHRRFLATGIRVALSSCCTKDAEKWLESPSKSTQQNSTELAVQQPSSFTPPWSVDDLLRLSDFESSSDKVRTKAVSYQTEWMCPKNPHGKLNYKMLGFFELNVLLVIIESLSSTREDIRFHRPREKSLV
uniref:B box-type domain-containing protein n=1 Tax=Rhizophora mucronata TaxID=61149 RepID=A0A2P2KRQ7_RHIMU